MDNVSVSALLEEWDVLDKEFTELEAQHKDYQRTVNESNKVQGKCVKGIAHQQYRRTQILQTLKYLRLNNDDDRNKIRELKKSMALRAEQISDIQNDLPKANGIYLNIILGDVSVSLPNKEAQYKYKEEYERFKLIVTCIILILSFLNIMFIHRAIGSILHFLQVWYYCTLTIRESILVVNGSRIKGWWRAHHFLTTIQAGIIIVWPDGLMYELFRKQLVWYTCYISFLQFLQFYYQQGCLYRLRSLGERYNMDITIGGFHSWMWRGLTFLLPFLYFGYFFQLYNAYRLHELSKLPECVEWQVFVSAGLFFIIFLGNSLTTTRVLNQKLSEKLQSKNLLSRKKDK